MKNTDIKRFDIFKEHLEDIIFSCLFLCISLLLAYYLNKWIIGERIFIMLTISIGLLNTVYLCIMFYEILLKSICKEEGKISEYKLREYQCEDLMYLYNNGSEIKEIPIVEKDPYRLGEEIIVLYTKYTKIPIISYKKVISEEVTN